MLVREIMNPNVSVVNQEKSLSEAAQLMRETNCGSIPVENNNKLVGMITDRDIAVRAVASGENPTKAVVKNHMSKGIKYCFDTDDLDDIGELMSQNQLRRLPVLNRDKDLVGIVSIGDLARYGKNEKLLYDTFANVCH
ncbi:MAG: CBS domain-containing protein [Bdellovibrionales bacterium]|nr:CBS domain-containing protein [Bdellovibrionales bacterium]